MLRSITCNIALTSTQ